MFKFTLVGDDLDTFRALLVEKVVSETDKMQEDMSNDRLDSCDYTIRTMNHMQEIAYMSDLYVKSINKMEPVNG